MYTKYQNYYEWNKAKIPDNGRKFFFCYIENNFQFEYWTFVPKEINKH